MKASCKNALRKPDAGNLHVRFEEGEGTRRSLALPHLVRSSLLYFRIFSGQRMKCQSGSDLGRWRRLLGFADFKDRFGKPPKPTRDACTTRTSTKMPDNNPTLASGILFCGPSYESRGCMRIFPGSAGC